MKTKYSLVDVDKLERDKRKHDEGFTEGADTDEEIYELEGRLCNRKNLPFREVKDIQSRMDVLYAKKKAWAESDARDTELESFVLPDPMPDVTNPVVELEYELPPIMAVEGSSEDEGEAQPAAAVVKIQRSLLQRKTPREVAKALASLPPEVVAVVLHEHMPQKTSLTEIGRILIGGSLDNKTFRRRAKELLARAPRVKVI